MQKQIKLLIRTDADVRLGTGHFMRCLALAQAWQDVGGVAAFLMSSCARVFEERLQSGGMEVHHLSSWAGSVDDAKQITAIARQVGASWAVVDGYHFDSEYQRVIKDSGLHLLLIDDMGYGEHYWADIVLNQNSHAHQSFYENKEPYTRLLLGTRYALLRRDFLRWQGWKREILGVAHRVLVTLGGGDPENVTLKVIQALNQIKTSELEVKVVVGPSNPHMASLKEAVHRSPFTVHRLSSVTDMPGLMAWADIAVTAGGSTCWELAYMGLPALVVVLAENQTGIAEGLNEAGAVVNLGRHDEVSIEHLVEPLSDLFRSPGRSRRMSQIGRSLVDGMGAGRVAEELRLRADMELSEDAYSVFG